MEVVRKWERVWGLEIVGLIKLEMHGFHPGICFELEEEVGICGPLVDCFFFFEGKGAVLRTVN
jgi:hypothetical protein